MSEYQKLIKKLFSLSKGKIKLKLENILLANAYLKHPDKHFKTIHIAGTNGKGSVSNKIAKALSLSGYKTGLFTSPHISCYRERIMINDKKISKKETIILLNQIFKTQKDLDIYLSFFEITTLLAFLYFSQKKVDFAIIETGLGGRLDATNIITPILSIITSISFDHTNLLGNTLDAIATEKAQIIKANIPVVVGTKAYLTPIIEKAKSTKSTLYRVSQKNGFYDLQNGQVAKTALEVLEEKYPLKRKAINIALKYRPSGRFEIFQFNSNKIIIDVAHNIEAFEGLNKAIKLFFPKDKIRVILGMSKYKDVLGCINIIKSFANFVHIVKANNIQSIEQNAIKQAFLKSNFSKIFVELTIKKAVGNAINNALKNSEILLICGSFYIIDEIKKHLKLKESNYINL